MSVLRSALFTVATKNHTIRSSIEMGISQTNKTLITSGSMLFLSVVGSTPVEHPTAGRRYIVFDFFIRMGSATLYNVVQHPSQEAKGGDQHEVERGRNIILH